MVWIAYITLPAATLIITTLFMTRSMSAIFWEDRVLLHLPLTVVPLLAIWSLSMPRLWKLWRETRKATGAPLSADIRKQAAHPMVIVPFQMSALGAVTIFYFLLVTPVPLQLTKAIVPILIWITATVALWYVLDRRWQIISHPEAVIVYQPWRRRLRALGIFCIAAGLAGIAIFIESQNSKLPAVMSMAEGTMDFGGGIVLAHNVKNP
jgi:hypothetical protein